MTVVILNSGVGKRLGKITRDKTKGMVEIREGESIFQNQVEKLVDCGLRKFVITTGYLREVFEEFAQGIFHRVAGEKGIQLEYKFVYNKLYDKTNYIMSLHKAAEATRDDIILMHGDLIFSPEIIEELMRDEGSRVVIDTTLPLPEKDFKARVDENGRVYEIDVKLTEKFQDEKFQDEKSQDEKSQDEKSLEERTLGEKSLTQNQPPVTPPTKLAACQPLYKLNRPDWEKWLDAIATFIQQGKDNCYAEIALNTITDQIQLTGYDVKGGLCMEIDNEEDLNKIKEIIEG